MKEPESFNFRTNAMERYTQFRLAAILILSFALTLFTQAADQVVTNNANSGAGSFRQAITDVTAGGTITFNLSAGNETITIASELVIIKAMTINGANTSGSGKTGRRRRAAWAPA